MVLFADKDITTAFVFATDETFAPLAKGLVMSIENLECLPSEFSLKMIDIGCSNETLGWMLEHNVDIQKFERNRFISIPIKAKLKQYQDAQLCRPFLPQIFPNYSTYIWCDSDIWIQNIDTLRLYRDIARSEAALMSISPLVDYSYSYFYKDCTEFSKYNLLWYSDTYGQTVASTYANRALLSSGLFALASESDIWLMWQSEIISLLQKNYEAHTSLHLAEQTALNYIAYSTGKYVPVSAMHNYNCHIGCAKRHDDGKVRVNINPYPEIGAIHLTYSSKMIGEYLDNGLLFDSGAYLSDSDLCNLKRLAHY